MPKTEAQILAEIEEVINADFSGDVNDANAGPLKRIETIKNVYNEVPGEVKDRLLELQELAISDLEDPQQKVFQMRDLYVTVKKRTKERENELRRSKPATAKQK